MAGRPVLHVCMCADVGCTSMHAHRQHKSTGAFYCLLCSALSLSVVDHNYTVVAYIVMAYMAALSLSVVGHNYILVAYTVVAYMAALSLSVVGHNYIVVAYMAGLSLSVVPDRVGCRP